VLFFAALAVPAFSQVAPAATGGGGMTFAVGGGVSDYHMDFGHGNDWGGTLWLDGNLNLGSPLLQGLAIEVEARDLSFDRSPGLPNNMRTDTLGGGVKYSWRRFHDIRPYAKVLASYGSLDLYKHGYHWTWVEWAPGGGIEYRPFGRIWLRADYEYQVWPGVIKYPHTFDLDPQGFTFGAVYEIGHPHSHR
jgi:opacity protein-like surface antigen